MKLFYILPALLLIAGCKPSEQAQSPSTAPAASAPVSTDKRQVYVANYPLQYFAQRLGDGLVDVHFPAPAGEDPAFWEPDDATIARYQAADLILMNGASYSKWVDTTTLPDDKVVNTASPFSEAYIEIKDALTHSHGPGGEHSHSGTAFTTWLDFQQAILQAQEVSKAIQALLPQEESKKTVQTRFEALKKDLESLDQRLLGVSSRIARAPLLASHPVYQYLARRYDLNIQSVHWEPETVPDNQAMKELQGMLTSHPAKWMIWEGPPAAWSVEKLIALGIQGIVFSPCANQPEEGDFMSVMDKNIKALETSFP